MTERELIEKAAKACGIVGKWSDNLHAIARVMGIDVIPWNPRWSPSDCSEMEARLMIDVGWFDDRVLVEIENDAIGCLVCEEFIDHNNDRQLARMMASTLAAAALGESM